jgi:hypothetical protein
MLRYIELIKKLKNMVLDNKKELIFNEERLNNIKETLKFDEGKPCVSDIPQLALMSVAKVFNYGAKKYSKFNYSGGTDWLRYYDAAQRHMNSWMIGEDIDESSHHHIDHAIASLMMLRENMHLKRGVDNRNPIYKSNEVK